LNLKNGFSVAKIRVVRGKKVSGTFPPGGGRMCRRGSQKYWPCLLPVNQPKLVYFLLSNEHEQIRLKSAKIV
jgi:hypothetical protein